MIINILFILGIFAKLSFYFAFLLFINISTYNTFNIIHTKCRFKSFYWEIIQKVKAKTCFMVQNYN